MMKKIVSLGSRKNSDLSFEDALSNEWASDPDVVELPLSNRSLRYVEVFLFIIAATVGLRVIFLNAGNNGKFYTARAMVNLSRVDYSSAPRGLIVDRFGATLATNKPVFAATLDLKAFLEGQDQEATLASIEKVLGTPRDDLRQQVNERDSAQVTDPIVLTPELSQDQLIQLKTLGIPSVNIVPSYEREYPDGSALSSVIGYTNLANAADIEQNSNLTSRDDVGRAGVESYYDTELRGTPSATVTVKDAKGRVLGTEVKSPAKPGATIRLTIDQGFQKYFYQRMQEGLKSLGRTAGGALAINPQTGEILALMSFPGYDNNIFVSPGKSAEKKDILTSSGRPLFNRIVSGQYNPGSTIKPLVAVAALKEGIIDPLREIFSPGYLELPNKYDPAHPLRFLDWRYQGNINIYTALAFSSDVYFYVVGGGADGIAGLGITKLRDWWDKFGLGSRTGIDLSGEAKGFLPSPDWKQKVLGTPWLLGDTFNVSIGQGDLLVTPVQLLNYIASIANGGTLYRPYIIEDVNNQSVLKDLSDLTPQIREIQKGMRDTVTNPRGTAYTLHDLPIDIAAKTGSAQVKNNTQENAFFVGYIPLDALAKVGAPTSRQIAILVMIENSKQGSLNAVPIARDVFNWYYENRLKNSSSSQ
jgi:penicillin-binding protein 2